MSHGGVMAQLNHTGYSTDRRIVPVGALYGTALDSRFLKMRFDQNIGFNSKPCFP